jgi:CDP-glycerol glycerophosphotransferase
MANQGNFSDTYLRVMRREAASWDYLLSPSPYCTDILPRALGYSGEVLEVGYPRNDVLARPDVAAAVRDQVRRELGVPDAHTVLLYAPTFRENARQGASFAKVLHLDAATVVDRRPDVTVLVRGHANTWARASAGQGDRVVDVTAYPDLARLFLASDLLVTDYSSVFFDYALTDRPVLFLVPDLADYRDRLRGFYLDLDEIAPGPLLRTTEEVLEHLEDDPAAYAERRSALRARFTPLDDGAATERLVERVFTS